MTSCARPGCVADAEEAAAAAARAVDFELGDEDGDADIVADIVDAC